MQRYTLRLLIAFVSFCLGVFVSQAFNSLENAIVDHFYPVSEIHVATVPVTDSLESSEIYGVILRNAKDAQLKLFVVTADSEGYISTDYSQQPSTNADPKDVFAKTVQRFMPEAETETLKNYVDVNKESRPLKILVRDLNVVLIPRPDFSKRTVWQEFYKSFPTATSLTFFSQIGFNNQHDQALVFVSRACGGLCGSGSYFLLKKTNGKWLILRNQGLFVS